ncbi:MAG: ATP-dependent RecD-like DNA helicase [Pseudomonadota bacterium]
MSEVRVEGELLGFLWVDERSSFAVGRFRLASGEEITAVGPLATARPGQTLHLCGRWEQHKEHGHQLRVLSFLADDPRTIEGLKLYLSSGAVQGIGAELAARLVDRFGLATLVVLAEQPERLQEVPGIGPTKAAAIRAAWEIDREDRELHAMLRGHGLKPAVTRRIVERYGRDALAMVLREPYRLAREVPGVGFKTADGIARGNGIGRDHPDRAAAAVLFTLDEAEDDGHCFLPVGELAPRLATLDVPEEAWREALRRLLDLGQLVSRPVADPAQRPLQHAWMARLERRVAERILDLVAFRPQPSLLTVRDAEAATGLTLNDDQRLAVEQGLQQGIVLITGGPGTGKTTIVKVLLAAARQLGQAWLLAAPTGRAARRLAEACDQDASTLHRLLEFSFPEMRFKRNGEHPLEAAGLIVDEASMVDLRLMGAVLDALPRGGRLVLVGDDHQLPAVGAGQVLGDIISSGAVPVVRLREIYRQVAGSGIVVNAHRVDQGEMPMSAEREREVWMRESRARPGGRPRRAEPAQDFFIVEREDPLEVQAALLEIITRRLPARGFDPMRDIQVLAPIHRGELGTVVLNKKLQEALNPGRRGLEVGGWTFRVGDRVIQTRNNYQTEVFNGEVGRVLALAEDGVTVDFDGHQVALAGDQLREIEPAYAITVHKSQGSEYPAVLVLVHRSHRVMLRRNLLYTAITRAASFCCLLGSTRAVRLAVGISGSQDRHTALADLLREGG